MKDVIKYAAINSLGTAAYIVFIVSLIFSLGNKFSGSDETLFVPIAMLMLLVFSVALVGSLIFGRPILWYIDGKKKDAVLLLAYTLGIFLAITLIAFLILIVISIMTGNVNTLPLADN